MCLWLLMLLALERLGVYKFKIFQKDVKNDYRLPL
jgi:hypothetical protein